jgi:hypothetical protein
MYVQLVKGRNDMGAVIGLIGLVFFVGICIAGYLIVTKLTIPAIRGAVRAGKKGVVIDPGSLPSTKDRLESLSGMLSDGSISQDEYNIARSKVLNSM